MSAASIDEQVKKTANAIKGKVPVLYQPAFIQQRTGGTDVEIVGVPDFLILDGNSYLIRDSAMAFGSTWKTTPKFCSKFSFMDGCTRGVLALLPRDCKSTLAPTRLSPSMTAGRHCLLCGVRATPDHQATEHRTL